MYLCRDSGLLEQGTSPIWPSCFANFPFDSKTISDDQCFGWRWYYRVQRALLDRSRSSSGTRFFRRSAGAGGFGFNEAEDEAWFLELRVLAGAWDRRKSGDSGRRKTVMSGRRRLIDVCSWEIEVFNFFRSTERENVSILDVLSERRLSFRFGWQLV